MKIDYAEFKCYGSNLTVNYKAY
ncbi:uncharacterized protein G2W53_006409 [Senna tora]|uniref:Uncharacterized protein n=1 Tax=Senna tora TaxID=362788 RepID=A0A834X582_9FABA|nr:uncharacterized protein G2W53_006409 [Senna tora]